MANMLRNKRRACQCCGEPEAAAGQARRAEQRAWLEDAFNEAWQAAQGDDFASRMARQSLVAMRSQTSTRDRYSRMDEGSKS